MASVLSIQSHVAYGYVGNRAAVFALERLGYPVQAIHTVQFSNHTGYGQWTGEAFSAEHVLSIAEGLEARCVWGDCQAVLSGYLGRAEMGEAVISIFESVKKAQPACLYHCDPVMGDVGRGVFVRPEIVPFMREKVVPHAHILTPNHFEFELLLENEVRSFEAAEQACKTSPLFRDKIVVIKSFRPDELSSSELSTYLYTPQGSTYVVTPYIDFSTPPNGTGDLFSALFLGHYLRERSATTALKKTVDAVRAVLDATYAAGGRELQLTKSLPDTLI